MKRAAAREPAPPRVGALERAIAVVSPAWARARFEERRRLWANDLQLRRYEGADRGRRTGDWRPPQTSANVETMSSARELRARSRDMVRNEPWARRIVRQWTVWLVGRGWQPAFEDGDPREDAWDRWARSRECDAESDNDFRALQRTAVACWMESGDALAVRRWAPEKEVPFDIGIYEPDYLDWGRDGAYDGGRRVIQGVQFDGRGRREGYWLFPEHPGGTGVAGYASPGGGRSTFYAAEDVLHLFERGRPGQVCGVPLVAAIMLKLHDWGLLTDARLLQQRNAAAWSWIERDLSNEPTDTSPADGTQRPSRVIQPGSVMQLDAGRTVEEVPSPDAGPFAELAAEFLREVAAGADLPYEILTGALANVTFANARVSWIPFLKELEDKAQAAFVPRFLDRVFAWFDEAAALRGVKGFGTKDSGRVDWTPPPRPQMDPAAENDADAKAVQNGFTSLSDVLRGRGLHRRRHLERVASDDALLDELGVVLASDPRKFGPVGATPGFELASKTAARGDARPGDVSPPDGKVSAK